MISIITPSYNQLAWLRLALASVRDQAGVEIEHIVQDGESDGIREFIARVPHNSHIRFCVERDAGMYDAINKGLGKANGEICAYLNSDEQYLPGALRAITDFFAAHPKTEIIFGDAILTNTDGYPLSYRRAILPQLAHLRLAPLNVLTCATFFRRELFTSGQAFPTHLKSAGDHHWVFHLVKSGVKMAVLQQPLSIFTLTGTNLSASDQGEEELRGWLPNEEKPRRWLTPLVVGRHRLRKFFAGAYLRRDLTLRIYTQASPDSRQTIHGHRVGYHWPRPAVPQANE